jgi:hypothetical protein
MQVSTSYIVPSVVSEEEEEEALQRKRRRDVAAAAAASAQLDSMRQAPNDVELTSVVAPPSADRPHPTRQRSNAFLLASDAMLFACSSSTLDADVIMASAIPLTSSRAAD